MSKLPNTWEKATLGDVADYINGRGFKKSEWSKEGLPIIRIQNLTGWGHERNFYKGPIESRHRVEDGDLLISWAATLGAHIYKGEDGALNQHIFKTVPYIDKEYLFYYINYFISELMRKTHGSGMVHITKTNFLSSPIPTAPEKEQGRIVSKIEELFSDVDAGTEALERVEANLKRYRASVLKAACEGKLVPTEAELAKQECREYEHASALLERILKERQEKWEKENPGKKYKEPEDPDTDDLPELPEGWVWTTMDQLSVITGGITLNASQRTSGKSCSYLRVANVYANRLNLDEIKTVKVTDAELGRALLQKKDLLIVEGNGSPEQIGRVARWDGSIEKCVHQNHLIKARAEADLSNYLLIYLLSPVGRSEIMKVASSTSGLYTLSLSKVKSISVPLPPKTEIERIELEVDKQDSLSSNTGRTLGTKIKTVQTLKQSILKKAFNGELVEQDPGDEPASVLLERIKTERLKREAKEKATKKSKKKSS